MKITTQLFESDHLILAGYDPDKDAAIESGFTRNLDYAWSLERDGIPHPLTVFEVKKIREEALKSPGENDHSFLFSIRFKEEDRFLGVVAFPWISWKNQVAFFRVNIGGGEDDERYFEEALEMALRYAFEELGVYRAFTTLGSHDESRLNRLIKAGMTIDVRQRQMFYRQGRLWDLYELGMSREKWLDLHSGE